MMLLPPSSEVSITILLAPKVYARRPLEFDLPNLQIPLLFVCGDGDWVDMETPRRLCREKTVTGRVVVITQCSHHFYLEQADQTTQALLANMKDGQFVTDDDDTTQLETATLGGVQM